MNQLELKLAEARDEQAWKVIWEMDGETANTIAFGEEKQEVEERCSRLLGNEATLKEVTKFG